MGEKEKDQQSPQEHSNAIKSRDIFEGPILPTLLRLSYPILIAMFSLTVFNIVDTFYVSRLGSDALTAMGFTFPIFIFLIAVGAGLTIGVSSLVARAIGAGLPGFASQSGKHGVIMAVALGLLVTGLGLLLTPGIVSFMGADKHIGAMTKSYVNVMLMACVFKYLLHVFEGTLRGEGYTRISMRMLLISSITNIVLDPFFIFGIWFFPRMEVQGAAVATAISWLVGCLYALDYYRRGKGIFNLDFRGFSFQFNYVRDIIQVGIPASLTQGFLSIALLLFNRILMIMPQGNSLVAAFGVGFRVEALVILPLIGLSAGSVVMIGQNFGAGKLKRVQDTIIQARWFVFLSMGAIGLVIIVLAPWMMRLFSEDPAVLAFGVQYLRITALTYGFLGVGMLANASFQGMGMGYPALVNIFIRFMAIQMTVAYGLAVISDMGSWGAWSAVALANLAYGLISSFWINSYVRRKIDSQGNMQPLWNNP